MKYLLCAFLIGLFVTSSFAGGKKFAQESVPFEIVDSGSGAGCNDTCPSLCDSLEDFVFDFPCDFPISGRLLGTRFTYPSDSLYFFELDYFCPPPNCFFPLS